MMQHGICVAVVRWGEGCRAGGFRADRQTGKASQAGQGGPGKCGWHLLYEPSCTTWFRHLRKCVWKFPNRMATVPNALQLAGLQRKFDQRLPTECMPGEPSAHLRGRPRRYDSRCRSRCMRASL